LKHKYGTKRFYANSDDTDMHYGLTEVTIPASHCPGAIERKLFGSNIKTENSKYFYGDNPIKTNKTDFRLEIESKLQKATEKSVLIFIHGYNTSFIDAVFSAAQVSHDIKYQGVPIVFSWPSLERAPLYIADKNNAYWASKYLEDLIKIILSLDSSYKINIIAHSMGNEVLTRALCNIEESHKTRFKNIVMCAPDLDKDIFREQIVHKIYNIGEITLYVSKNDHALNTSKTLQGSLYHRVGDSEDETFTHENIVTIDASYIKTDFMHHSYFSQSKSILFDLINLFGTLKCNMGRRNYLIACKVLGRDKNERNKSFECKPIKTSDPFPEIMTFYYIHGDNYSKALCE